MKTEEKIDFVVTWLDSNDPEWIETYRKYRGGEHKEDKGRYRDWDIFKYWFRAVEKYAPWVNKVFLVTNGKNPDWINKDNPKLALVSHSDYMPEKYLPTFNSRAIELNFHRIEGLSEHFVYFNDDFFLNNYVFPEDYFRKGLPCDCNAEKFLIPAYHPTGRFSFGICLFCNIAFLNYHFDRSETIRQAPAKWLGPHLWGKYLPMTLFMMGRHQFVGFTLRHHEQPMLKSVLQEIWEKEEAFADQTCTQFRSDLGFNPYIVRYWQFASNRFYPVRNSFGKYFTLGQGNDRQVQEALLSRKYRSICLNDTTRCNDEAYDKSREMLHSVFEKKFPAKSSFEL